MIERTTKMYITRVLLKMIFQIETNILIRIIDCLIICFWIFLMCESHFSLVFICRSSTRMFVFDSTTLILILMMTIMLNFFEFLVKWMSSYFVEANTNSCRWAYLSQSRCTRFNVLQFSFVFLSYVSMLTSSAYLRELVLISNLSHIFSRSAL
jgi:hypothetical protein